MPQATSATLFSFIDEQSESIIAITGDSKAIQKIAGGVGATISVDCIVLVWGMEYIVSDILIDTLNKPAHFDPSEYEDLSIGNAIDYTISVRIMVNCKLN